MRLLIFIFALTSAFFVSSVYSFQLDMDNLLSPKSDSVHLFKCHFVTDWGPTYDPTIESTPSTAMDDCSSWGLENIDREQVCGSTSVVGVYYGMFIKPRNQLREDGTCIIGGNGGGTVTFTAEDLGESVSYSCPPTQSSLHIYEVSDPQNPSSIMCAKELTIEPDSDCPAPTDNDPFVFGTGQQQTVCFNNPDGTQCSIETDENGNFYMPVSYGSQEPVACTQIDPTDPDPTDPDPTEPDPTEPDPTDPDKTPDPDPLPEPEPTDDKEATDLLPAINQVNKNLDAINTNMNNGFESNHDRLDRIAEEIQISNKLANEHVYESKAIKDAIIGANEITLGILQDMKNGVASIGTAISETNSRITEGNQKLGEISDGINSTFEEGTCIGELCTLDLSKELDDFDKSFSDFVNDEKDQKVPREFESYLHRLDSYVSSAFSGFSGQCVPFDIRVSIRNVERVISVGQHCPYYDDYFKPVIEWFLYVMTFVSVLNITSQSFRAFSTV